MLKLNATTTALVVIDLQEGILRVVPTARPWLWYASDGLMIMPKR